MILHVDMDAFFASVEVLDNPALKGKCVIVGGTSGRGVVSAASYEARVFGVHSAMPMYLARQKCPHGIFLRPRGRRYSEISKRIMAVLDSFSPLVQQVSVDEAYVDISGLKSLYGTPLEIGGSIKQAVHGRTGLTCSVGIAPVKFLAKIASDLEKPDGLTCIMPEDMPSFLDTLPVSKIPGVGARTEQQLRKLGIVTLADVKRCSEAELVRCLGKFGHRLRELAHGVDHCQVRPERTIKSVSSEETLANDTRDKALLKTYLLKQSEEVGRDLRRHHTKAKTVVLKLKHADFRQVTRQAPLGRYTAASEILYAEAARLLDEYPLSMPVRLIGLGAADLNAGDRPVQQDLFPAGASGPPATGKWEALGDAVDRICEKFGGYAIKKAGLCDHEKKTDQKPR